MPALAALANGLADDEDPNPSIGAAVLKFELVEGFVVDFDFDVANGEEVPEPKEEKGLTKGLDVVEAEAGAGEEFAGEYEDVGRPKLACTRGVLPDAESAFSTGAAGLGGADISVGVLAMEVSLPSVLIGARMGVSTSAKGRGVSGGLASVEISDKASDGVSRPDEDVDLGNAE